MIRYMTIVFTFYYTCLLKDLQAKCDMKFYGLIAVPVKNQFLFSYFILYLFYFTKMLLYRHRCAANELINIIHPCLISNKTF